MKTALDYNREVFERYRLTPRRLIDVSKCDIVLPHVINGMVCPTFKLAAVLNNCGQAVCANRSYDRPRRRKSATRCRQRMTARGVPFLRQCHGNSTTA